MTKRFSVGWSVLLIVAATGCSGGDTPPLSKVTGSVVRDGEPMTGVYIEFHPQAGRRSFGETGADGTFELRYDPQNLGAVIGVHEVLFHVPTGQPDMSGVNVSEMSEAQKEQFKRRSRSEPTRLSFKQSVTVTKKGPNEFHFDLTDKS